MATAPWDAPPWMAPWQLALMAATVFVAVFIVRQKKKKTTEKETKEFAIPPGPRPLPLIGNVHQFERDQVAEAIAAWSCTYGPFVTVRFASRINVVANTIDSCREVLVKNGIACAGREDNFMFRLYSPNMAGVAMSDYGDEWKFCRKITHSCLKMYGSHRTAVEGFIKEECAHLVAGLRADRNISMKRSLELSITNVIAAMLFGHRYGNDDPEFERLAESSSWFTDAIGALGLTFLSPWLRYLYAGKIAKFRSYVKTRDDLLDRKLKEHRQSYEKGKTRDFVDAIIEQSEACENAPEIPPARLSEHLRMIMADILFAGVDTTHNSLLWAMLLLLRCPEKQTRLAEELRTNLTSIGDLRYEDRASFPYLEATIHEVLRVGSISSLGITHKAMQDVTVGGYHIPQGTVLLTNIYAVHHDTDYWEEPHEFRPERFIDGQGRFLIPNRSFLPFSDGPRSCVGKNLAKMEHYYFVAYLVYHFKIEPPVGQPLPTLSAQQKAVRETTPFELVLRKR